MLIPWGRSFAACTPPTYSEGVVISDSADSTLMQINVKAQDFAPQRLICLAQNFKKTFPGRKIIDVYIFSSHDAAVQYRIVRGDYVGGPKIDWAKDLHAEYFYDADK